jgi:hypothetical protein
LYNRLGYYFFITMSRYVDDKSILSHALLFYLGLNLKRNCDK